MANLKSFNIPVISSWKYAGACASPKGTLMYSYFQNGEVKAVLGMDASSKGILYSLDMFKGPMWRNILPHSAERKYPLPAVWTKWILYFNPRFAWVNGFCDWCACVNPLIFALASLALLSLVRSAGVSMSVRHSSSLVELCSLKMAVSCSSDLVRYDCFCVVCKVSVYYHITSLKGLLGVGGGGRWSAIERFWSLCSMCFKVSAGCSSPASIHWCKSFISLMSAANLSWLLYTGYLGCPSASGPPKATVASELWVVSLLTSACSGSSTRISMPLFRGILHLHGRWQ